MTTLKDIAKEAGVNVSTVSRALKGDTEIAKDTRERISDIAFRMGYRDRKKKDKTHIIGIIIPDMTSGFFANILVEMDRRLSEIGYTPIYCPFFFDDDSCKKAMEICLKHRVEGIFLICAPPKMSRYVEQYVNYNRIPIVSLIPIHGGYHFMDSVRIDYAPALSEAIWLMKQKGHQKIGIMTDAMNYDFRRAEFEEAFRANGISEKEVPVYLHEERFEKGGYLAMKKALADPMRPTAFLVGYDHFAFGAYRAINEAGLSIPKDVAMCSFDDVSTSAYLTPSLTSIASPIQELVELGMNYMVKMLDDENKEKAIYRTTLNCQLNVRESI